MNITGQVMSVRPWDFKGKDGGRIDMLSLEVYDETAGLCRIEMRQDGVSPKRKEDVMATVTGIKPAKFGGGVVMSVKDLRLVVDQAGPEPGRWTPPPPNAPGAGAPPASPSGASTPPASVPGAGSSTTSSGKK